MKKTLRIILTLMLIVVGIATFSACTKKIAEKSPYDASGEVINNGTPVVRKGKYIYFANGYQDKFDGNEWGKPVKGALYRAEVDEKGIIKKNTQKPFVKTIVWTSEKSNEKMGLYIYNNWIYYASPSIDRDSNGQASKTKLDFWRTKLDGSVTQKIHTVNNREVDFMFKENHLIYFLDKTLYTLDFSHLNSVKNNSQRLNKRVQKTLKKIEENVTSYLWRLDSDYIFYVYKNPKDTSEDMDLMRSNYKGGDKKAVIPKGSYLTDAEKAEKEKHKDKLFGFRLISWLKTDTENTILYQKVSQNTVQGSVSNLYANKILEGANLNIKNEKHYGVTDRAGTYFFLLGYDKGVYEYDGSKLKYKYYDGDKLIAHTVYEKEVRYAFYDGENKIYFLKKETGDVLYSAELNRNPLEIVIKGLAVKHNYSRPVMFGDILYYFNEKDGYLYCVDTSNHDNKPTNVSVEEKKKSNTKK